MPALFSEGFLLGLSTGFYCLASCLPLLAPYLMAEGKALWKFNFFIFLQFTGGRFAAYMLFALLASLAGRAGQSSGFPGLPSVCCTGISVLSSNACPWPWAL